MHEAQRERDRRVLAGEEAPPACFTCGEPATHVSTHETPAGYRAYQCQAHAKTKPLWGHDPGWPTEYAPLMEITANN